MVYIIEHRLYGTSGHRCIVIVSLTDKNIFPYCG